MHTDDKTKMIIIIPVVGTDLQTFNLASVSLSIRPRVMKTAAGKYKLDLHRDHNSFC